MTLAAIYLLSYYTLGLPVWLWCILFFLPDIGMLGYALNIRCDAFLYNLFHHKGVAIAIAGTGYLMSNEVLIAVGLLLFAHASFDRILGYGLKYETGFKDTHLGALQKQPKGAIAL
ncbi:MAG: hypothetical protein JWP69_1621 [Flaviaesturariibacter sp.]|nr:hypothetical protein [Flaviaesturariibacter sp.]